MPEINNHDILFILNKTRLSISNLVLLIEEERDFNLLLSSIASHLSDKEVKQSFPLLSPSLKIKLSIYNHSKDKDYDIEDKSFISDILIRNYDYLYKPCHIIKNNQPEEIKDFLSVIHSESIDKGKIPQLVQQFKELGKPTIANNIFDWINIINNSRKMILSVKK